MCISNQHTYSTSVNVPIADSTFTAGGSTATWMEHVSEVWNFCRGRIRYFRDISIQEQDE